MTTTHILEHFKKVLKAIESETPENRRDYIRDMHAIEAYDVIGSMTVDDILKRLQEIVDATGSEALEEACNRLQGNRIMEAADLIDCIVDSIRDDWTCAFWDMPADPLGLKVFQDHEDELLTLVLALKLQ